jgi:hypothetical protein
MLTKAKQKRLLGMVKTLLTHRRNGKPRYEQSAYEKLVDFCRTISVDPSDAIEQGIAYLKRTSIAASMNGLV